MTATKAIDTEWVTVSRPRGRPAPGLERPEAPLADQVSQLYALERQLAVDLPHWFRRADSIPLRMIVADQRRDLNRQVLRLERIIQLMTGGVASRLVGQPVALSPVALPPGDPDGLSRAGAIWSTLAALLHAARGSIREYGAALASAQRLGQSAVASLLAESLGEKRTTTIALSRLAGTLQSS
jgi:ferritin-like metal-binding protein YciE